MAAVQSAQLNAQANDVHLAVGLPEMAEGLFGVVFANILATPLKVLAPLLCSHVEPGGQLILAGILERQTQELIDAYAPYCTLQVTDTQEGWVLMTARIQ
jgi:ribosomal protein L11 methyltransferase